jgi:hypothetical protein
MPLPSSGTLSMNDIRVELGVPAQAPMSLQAASVGTYGTINVCSVSRPNGSAPYAISEWYGYCHTCSCTPTQTPTPTPTPTSLGNAIQLSTPQTDSCVACRLTTFSQTRYVTPGNTTPDVNDVVYQNSDLSTLFNGNNQWFKTDWGGTLYSIQINTLGVVTSIQTCSACPSTTPTPTPTRTPTPTPTPTPTSTPIVSYLYCLGYNASSCSAACDDYFANCGPF